MNSENSQNEEEAHDHKHDHGHDHHHGDVKTEKVINKDKKVDKKAKGIGSGKCCMIYPDNRYKSVWDMVIALILIVSCILSPLFIAFDDG